MKRFVNILSIFRIIAAFAIIPTLMFQMYWLTFVLFVLAALSDWADGFLARRYDACSKIGGVMDHIGDKLLVVNAFIMLAIMMPVWFVVIPIIIMIARELYISGLREFLGTQKIEMPVPHARFSLGKVKTTLQMITIAMFLLLFTMSKPLAAGMITRTQLMIMNIVSQVGIIGMWAALVTSILSAVQYTRTFAEKFKKIKK